MTDRFMAMPYSPDGYQSASLWRSLIVTDDGQSTMELLGVWMAIIWALGITACTLDGKPTRSPHRMNWHARHHATTADGVLTTARIVDWAYRTESFGNEYSAAYMEGYFQGKSDGNVNTNPRGMCLTGSSARRP